MHNVRQPSGRFRISISQTDPLPNHSCSIVAVDVRRTNQRPRHWGGNQGPTLHHAEALPRRGYCFKPKVGRTSSESTLGTPRRALLRRSCCCHSSTATKFPSRAILVSYPPIKEAGAEALHAQSLLPRPHRHACPESQASPAIPHVACDKF